MTPLPVTEELLHQLVASSHAEDVTEIAVACTIDHDGRTLLIAEPGLNFIDGTWELPTGWVLSGETLTDALARVLAALGLELDEVTSYLGHRDRVIDVEEVVARVFCFAVTVTRPDRVCRSALIGHWWADPCDLPQLPTSSGPCSNAAGTTRTPTSRSDRDPPLAEPLRTWAHGLCALQAGIELFIRHGTWLHRNDFRDRFVHLDTITNGTELATIDWLAAIAAIDTGDLPCSGGERRMLRLAASLADGIPVDLRDALTGLDDRNLDLVSQAVLHTAGR